MTEESENKYAELYEQERELIKKIESLPEDEYLANKTYYDNELKKLDEQINAARKEVTDAKMNANQFKTTGTTDFFRWKKDKEYASDVAAINRAMLDEQTKNEKLSNLEMEIKAKELELKRTNDKNTEIRIRDELKLLKEQYNDTYGKQFYQIDDTPKGGEKPLTPEDGDTQKQTQESIEKAIAGLKFEENLDNSADVEQIRTYIGKLADSAEKFDLGYELYNKIEDLKRENIEKLLNGPEWKKDLANSDAVEQIRTLS